MDDLGLRPGRYAYEGKDEKMVEMFDDNKVDELVSG